MRKILCAVALVLSSLAMTAPAPAAAATYCPGVYCNQDADCWTYCAAGEFASYCNRALHRCFPY